MTTLTAQRAMADIQQHAERIRSDELQQFPVAASPGDAARQGDLYITLLADVPSGANKTTVERQLAPGNTQGSRHILDAKAGVTMYRLESPGMLDGPILKLTKGRVATHPEHGDIALPPGCYQITYQRNLDAEEREQRVVD